MKNKWIRWFCAVVMILMILIGNTNEMVFVKAAAIVKLTSQGIVNFENGDASIELKGNAGQTLAGKKLYLYRLFDAENAANLESIDYTLNQQYEKALKTVVGKKLNKSMEQVTEYEVIDYIQSMNSYVVEGAQTEQTVEGRYSDYRYFVEELLAEIHAEGISEIEIHVADTKINNSIEIEGLPYGYYILEDATETEGEHTAVSLTMLSTANPKTSINIKADYPTVTKKIQEDDNRNEIGADGWNDIADYEIGQDVPYRLQSNIPNINGYDTYYYAWHDKMDEALDLQNDSVQISITGQILSGEKVYQLRKDEFQLVTNVENATFLIEVEDIKAIIDREFPQLDDRNENVYGQTVTVTYKATLNEKAVLDTGRPGFENDVRLEFSNNPNAVGKGQTGFTPWDTVVCFTYQLEAVKVNNEGAKLEGAKFRLYYDEKCENEVFVKQGTNGYVVMQEKSAEATSMESDANGKVVILGLDSGKYYLKETDAPAGYRPILDPIELKITAVFPNDRNSYVKGDGASEDIFELTATAHIITFTNGKSNEENTALGTDTGNGKVNISVVNEIGNKLPITGSYFMPVLTGTGILLLCLAMKKGRKKHE